MSDSNNVISACGNLPEIISKLEEPSHMIYNLPEQISLKTRSSFMHYIIIRAVKQLIFLIALLTALIF